MTGKAISTGLVTAFSVHCVAYIPFVVRCFNTLSILGPVLKRVFATFLSILDCYFHYILPFQCFLDVPVESLIAFFTSEILFFISWSANQHFHFVFFFLPWFAGQGPFYAVMPNRPTGLDGDFHPPLNFLFIFHFFSCLNVFLA